MLKRPPGFCSWHEAVLLGLGGLAVAIGVALGFAILVNLEAGVATVSEVGVEQGYWHVRRVDGWAHVCVRSIRDTAKRSWAPEQATGQPDTPLIGDHATAWAPTASDAGMQWLRVEYDRPVEVVAVRVFESCGAGALTMLSVFDAQGREEIIWRSPRRSTQPGTQIENRVALDKPVTTRSIKVYMDTTAVPGWNEIDAVGAQDASGQTHWAVSTTASSIYGVGYDTTTPLAEVLPRWAMSLGDPPAAPLQPGQSRHDVAAAFGFPMAALSARWTQNSPSGVSLGYYATPAQVPARVMPTRPIWLGLIVDAFVFALALRLVTAVTRHPRRVITELRRVRRGCCLQCGYDLRYNFADGCPECGWLRKRPT